MWTGVERLVADAESHGVVIGVCVIAPSGERYSHNGERRFVAASTVKIPIMIELFRQTLSGEQVLDGVHTLAPEDIANGSGVLAHLHIGIEFTVADLAYLMMSISDNSSTNILIDMVGMDRVNATMGDLGMSGSTLGRKMQGIRVGAGDQENWAVPNDYARSISSLFDNSAASPAACVRMLDLLAKQQNERRIARYLPQGDKPRWGSKTGTLPGVVNDVGFIMTAHGPLIIAAFCEGLNEPHSGEQIIGNIARAALLVVEK